MSQPITIPAPEEIAERIRACRVELAALRKLQRMARAAQAAEEARRSRGEPNSNTVSRGLCRAP